MEAVINFFTVTPNESLFFVLLFGMVGIFIGWFNEAMATFRRLRYLFSESTRGLFTWQTAAWMPVRLFVLIILPQVLYQFFTSFVKLG